MRGNDGPAGSWWEMARGSKRYGSRALLGRTNQYEISASEMIPWREAPEEKMKNQVCSFLKGLCWPVCFGFLDMNAHASGQTCTRTAGPGFQGNTQWHETLAMTMKLMAGSTDVNSARGSQHSRLNVLSVRHRFLILMALSKLTEAQTGRETHSGLCCVRI